jgi:hypothetical protein
LDFGHIFSKNQMNENRDAIMEALHEKKS